MASKQAVRVMMIDNDENLVACRPGMAEGKRQLSMSACV